MPMFFSVLLPLTFRDFLQHNGNLFYFWIIKQTRIVVFCKILFHFMFLKIETHILIHIKLNVQRLHEKDVYF